MRPPERLTQLEVACGLALGLDGREVARAPAAGVREALDGAILPALRRSPCVMSFSGGRDSSAVLAVATQLARRQGLPLPIPATNRFPVAPKSYEAEWQELVVAHVGSEEWLRLDWTDELDLAGPYALELLGRHGLLWPFNLHFHLPLLDAAGGGSLLTGIGGDELFGGSRWLRAQRVLSGRARPTARDALRVALALSPRPIRRHVLRTRIELSFDWLLPSARDRVLHTLAAEAAWEPLRASARARWLRQHRYLQLGIAHFHEVAAARDVLAIHPLAAAAVVDAVTALPPLRHRGRTAAMRHLFGDDLPDALVERTTKSSFNGAFWTRHAREVADGWDGTGVDEGLVDTKALRREWSSDLPDGRTYLLLQSVALRRLRASQRAPEAISSTACAVASSDSIPPARLTS